MKERALEDGHSFLMADVFNRHQNEDFLLDLERSSRNPKVERDDLGWGLGQNAAFPHGLGVVFSAVEDCIDGPAGRAMHARAAAVRPFFGPNALDRLSGSLFDEFRHAGTENVEQFPVGGHDLPIAVEDHHHVRHGIQSVFQQRQTFDDRCLATKLGGGVPASGSKVRLRWRKRGQGVQRVAIELVGAENVAHVVSFDLGGYFVLLDDQTGLGSFATHVSSNPTSFFGSMGLLI